jgi:energy-converting hydrogenase Eha subunit G
VQAHLSYGVVTAVVGGAAVVSGAVTWVLDKRKGRPARRLWLPLAIAAAVTVICWVAPLFQQLTSKHPNLSAILGGVGPGGESSHLPAATARRLLAATYGLPALWTGRERWLAPVGPFTWITAVAVWVALIALLVWAVRAKRKAVRSLLLVTVAAGVGLFATTQFSPNTLDRQSFRYLWAVGPFTWFAVVASGLVPALPVLRRRVRPQQLAWGAAAALGALVLFAAVATTPLSEGAVRDGEVVGTVSKQLVSKLETGRRYGLAIRGPAAFVSIEPGLLRSLDQHGLDVRLTYHDEQAYGSGWTRTDNPGGTLVLVTGAGQPAPPTGKLVARSEAHSRPRTDLEPAILNGIAKLDRIELSSKGKQLLRDVLASQAASSPEQRAVMRSILGAEPTAAGIQEAFRNPARLVQRGLIESMLKSGGLGYLAENDLMVLPQDLRDTIIRYEQARLGVESTTSVYLVPAGKPTS